MLNVVGLSFAAAFCGIALALPIVLQDSALQVPASAFSVVLALVLYELVYQRKG